MPQCVSHYCDPFYYRSWVLKRKNPTKQCPICTGHSLLHYSKIKGEKEGLFPSAASSSYPSFFLSASHGKKQKTKQWRSLFFCFLKLLRWSAALPHFVFFFGSFQMSGMMFPQKMDLGGKGNGICFTCTFSVFICVLKIGKCGRMFNMFSAMLVFLWLRQISRHCWTVYVVPCVGLYTPGGTEFLTCWQLVRSFMQVVTEQFNPRWHLIAVCFCVHRGVHYLLVYFILKIKVNE